MRTNTFGRKVTLHDDLLDSLAVGLPNTAEMEAFLKSRDAQTLILTVLDIVADHIAEAAKRLNDIIE